MSVQVAVPQAAIAAFCQKYHIRKLSLFGSVLRDDFTDQSDVDVLIDFEADHSASLFDLVHMEEELSAIFAGRKVDLIPANSLIPRLRKRILAAAEVQYERTG